MDRTELKSLVDSILRLALSCKAKPLRVINCFSSEEWSNLFKDDYPLFKELMLNYMEAYERRYLK